MWLSGSCLVLLFLFLLETSSANILFRRAQRLRMILAHREETIITSSGKETEDCRIDNGPVQEFSNQGIDISRLKT